MNKYFCEKCKAWHRETSKAYKKHESFKKIEKDNIPSKEVIPTNYSDLPDIAKRQISTFLRKIELDEKNNHSKKRSMYIREINRVILHENGEL